MLCYNVYTFLLFFSVVSFNKSIVSIACFNELKSHINVGAFNISILQVILVALNNLYAHLDVNSKKLSADALVNVLKFTDTKKKMKKAHLQILKIIELWCRWWDYDSLRSHV